MKLDNLGIKKLIQNKNLSWIMITISAILYSVGYNMFLNVINAFSAGLGAFASLFGFIFPIVLPFFSLIYFAINMPFILFFWKRINKKFIYRTLYFLVLQAIISIPLILDSIHVLHWSLINNFAGLVIDHDHISNHNIKELSEEGWPIYILAIIGSIIVGVSIAIAWKFGGSTGGTDFIVYYFSTKRQMNIGAIMFILSVSIVTVSFTITIAVNPEITDGIYINDRWLMRLLSTITYIFLVSTIVNFIYPKYSKVKVSVSTEKHKELIKHLKEIKYHHAYTTIEEVSGHTGKTRYIVQSVMFLLEERDFVKIVKEVCDDAWIATIPVKNIKGKLSTKKIDH